MRQTAAPSFRSNETVRARFRFMLRNLLNKKLCLLVVTLLLIAASHISSLAQKTVTPVGCFHDLQEKGGDIFGFGVIKIWIRGGRYRGSFAERRTELGEHYEAKQLKNIRYDQRSRILRFTITFNNVIPAARIVSGKLSKRGFRLDVGKRMRDEYNGPNPFFRRKFEDCY